MTELEQRLWEDTPLYSLMCDVMNGDRSDWMTGAGEPSHVAYMTGREAEYPERSGPCCLSGSDVYVPE